MSNWTMQDNRLFEEDFIPFLIQQYGLQTRCLVYDTTNFFTYIDMDKAELAKAENIRLLEGDEEHLSFHYIGGLEELQKNLEQWERGEKNQRWYNQKV